MNLASLPLTGPASWGASAPTSVPASGARFSRPLRSDELRALSISQAAGAMMVDSNVRELVRQARKQVSEELHAAGFKASLNMLSTDVKNDAQTDTLTVSQPFRDPVTGFQFDLDLQLIVANRASEFGQAYLQMELLHPENGRASTPRDDRVLARRVLVFSKKLDTRELTDDPQSQLSAHFCAEALDTSVLWRQAVIRGVIAQLTGVLAQ